jgi:MFS family permease
MLRLCTLVITGAFIGQALAGGIESLTLWRCVQGLCQGGIGALGMVLLALYAPPSRRAPILTLSLLPQQMAWFLGPLLGSFFATFSLSLPFWVAAFALLAGGIASFRLPAPSTAGTD